MALPLIPIIAIAALAMFAGGGKKKRRSTPIPPLPPNGDIDEGELYAFGLGDFMPGEPLEVDVFPGDMIRFDFDVSGPAEWTMYTEVVEGAPVLVAEEDLVEPAQGPEGAPGRYIADLLVQPGLGTINMNFVLTEVGDVENPAVLRSERVIIRVV